MARERGAWFIHKINFMKLSLFLLSLLVSCSFGQSSLDFRFMEQNIPNTGQVTRWVPIPAGGANGIFSLIGDPGGGFPTPVVSTFSTGLVFDSVNKTVSVSGPASMITDFSSVTNGIITTALAPYSTTATINSALTGKMDIPSGSSATYLRGDGVWATFPTDLSGFSNSSGFITNSTNSLANYTNTTSLNSALSGKVDKVTGYGLSQENFSTVEKTKLSTLATQVQADWNASSGVSFINNKPSALSQFSNDQGFITNSTTGLTNYPSNSSLATTLSNYPTNSSLASTLSSYPTNSSLTSTLSGYATNSSLTSGLSGKLNVLSGTSAQYLKGDNTLGTFPTAVSFFTNDSNYVTSSGLTTSLGSYVTSASLSTTLGSYATSASVTSGLAGKFNNPSGTTSQYIRGDGSLQSFPVNVSSFTNDSNYVTSSGLSSTLSSYVTSGSLSSTLSGYATTGNLSSGLATKLTIPAGSSSQYVNGTGGLTTFPVNVSSFSNDAGYLTSASITRTFNNTPSRSIVSTAAAANGFQLSSTRDSSVSYSISITTSATIGGNSAGAVVLEICPTNSSTAANWIEIGRASNSQAITLAVALNSVQVNGSTLAGMVPAGYYTRLRSINTSGSPSFSFISGQEVLN